jgi:RHS repeat-associated protein
MTKALGVLALATVLLAPAAASAQVVSYYHLDAVGNVLAVTDQAGVVVEQHDYLPFGEEWNPTPGTQPIRFTGKERDTETGLDYFAARYYGSRVGRFTTTDPACITQENLVDPQRWNKYAYGRNNPLRFNDPDGRSPTIVTGLIGAGIGGAAGFIGSVGTQFVRNDYSLSNFNLQDAGAAALGGAVSGGLAGLTLGASLVAEAGLAGVIVVGGGSNAVGGAVTRAVDSSAETRAGDFKEIAIDIASGGVSGALGAGIEKAVSSPLSQLGGTEAGMRAAARRGGAGSFGAAKGAEGVARKSAATKTAAEIAATVVGAKATNVVTPIGRELVAKNAQN